jgi:hypothetical protein
MRNDQDIGKQDRGVEAEPADRLQRHFGRQLGRKAEIEKARDLCPHGPIFRQVTARLPHHPDRRNPLWLPRQRRKQLGLGHDRHDPLSF